MSKPSGGDPDAAERDATPPPAIVTKGIRMVGPWGPVYGPLDPTIPVGGVSVLVSGWDAARRNCFSPSPPHETEIRWSSPSWVPRAKDRHLQALRVGRNRRARHRLQVRDGPRSDHRTARWDASWCRFIRLAGQEDLTRVCARRCSANCHYPADGYFEQLSGWTSSFCGSLANTWETSGAGRQSGLRHQRSQSGSLIEHDQSRPCADRGHGNGQQVAGQPVRAKSRCPTPTVPNSWNRRNAGECNVPQCHWAPTSNGIRAVSFRGSRC